MSAESFEGERGGHDPAGPERRNNSGEKQDPLEGSNDNNVAGTTRTPHAGQTRSPREEQSPSTPRPRKSGAGGDGKDSDNEIGHRRVDLGSGMHAEEPISSAQQGEPGLRPAQPRRESTPSYRSRAVDVSTDGAESEDGVKSDIGECKDERRGSFRSQL